MYYRKSFGSAIALAAVLVSSASAQIRSATITGTAIDSTGALLPGAKVTVTNEATNETQTTDASSSGQYTIPYLAAGKYTVTVSKGGFQDFKAKGVVLNTSQTVKVDSTLSVGGSVEQVEVNASAAQIQTESSTVSGAVDAQTIEAIPNITQNPLYYATLQNGVQPRNTSASTQNLNSFGVGVAGRAQFSAIGVNGGRAYENDIQLDGLPITGNGFNEAAIVPNTEGIQEVRVIANNFTADYGRGDSVMAITTKSGGNAFHGQVSYMIRNEALNANSPGNKAQGIRRPAFKVNDFGGAITGPIWRDRIFFSSSYHYLRFNQGQTYLQTVPTALERVGDFSKTFQQDANGNPVPALLFDPFNVTQRGTNLYERAQIPNSIIPNPNPYAVKMFSYYPLPNRTPDDVYNTNNFTATVVNMVRRQSSNNRLDFKWGRHSFYASGGIDYGTISQPRPFGTAPFNNAPTTTQDQNPYAQIGDTITLSPTLYVDVRYGVTRINTYNYAGNHSGFTDYGSFGIPTATQALFAQPGAAPVVSPAGFGGSGGGSNWSALSAGQFASKAEHQLVHAINGSVTKVAGKWTYKVGSEYRVMLANYNDFEEASANIGGCCAADPGGNYSFRYVTASGGQAPGNTSPNLQGISGATMLLGEGVWFVRPGANLKPAYAAKYFAVYSQNDWKVRPNLTINLGLRWDLQPGPTERYNRLSGIDFTRNNPFGSKGVIAFPGTNGYSRNLWDTEYTDFQPRVGLAYQVHEGTVIRGGFAFAYLPSNTGYFSSPNDYGGTPFSPGNQALPFGTNPQGVPVTRFTDASPLVPAVGANAAAPQVYGTTGAYFDRHLKNQLMKQGNVFLEQAFGKGGGYLFSLGWAGSYGSNLTTRNQPFETLQSVDPSTLANYRSQYIANNGTSNPATALVQNPYQPTGGQLLPFQNALAGSTIQQFIPQTPYPLLYGAFLNGSRGYSNFNSLQASLRHNFQSGFNMILNYTWSKELDYSVTGIEDGQGVNAGGSLGTPDLLNNGLNRNYGLADQPHRLVATLIYKSQFGKDGKYALGNVVGRVLLGGWSFGSVITMQSGMPVVLSFSNNGSLTSRLDRVAGQNVVLPKEFQKRYNGSTTVTLPCGKTVTPAKYSLLKYNACAYSSRTLTTPNGSIVQDLYWVGNHAQTDGNIRTNSRYNVDFSLRRSFPLFERFQLDVAAEATNLLNTAEYNGAYVGGLGSPNLVNNASKGLIPGLGTSSTFGTVNMNAFDPRQIQMHARLVF
ncbi:TonB-dependent receptor [Terriglobus roseus]|uniref:Carboxypeptidase regulatory-like domain-containing protein n=1 Tax=Terriglobus roseus TaxID=392734 RepID=A0A1G7I0L3_9BACT|nr:TonB-dependent receptor [Terriglobus roseus]SDF06272.1 Carboxypeptidase regulatory-like domain-containing protein [Terriglobus roseus]